MARYIVLFNYTDQGIKNITETIGRSEAVAKMAKKMGASAQSFYWTSGAYDGVLMLDAPDDTTAAALLTKVGSLGNVHTHTLRAFDAAEMKAILAKAQ